MPTPARSGTLPIAVANTGFLLDRIGMDCDNLQFLRELTQNSIEAILRTPEKKGDIVWDVDWVEFELTGRYKLCVTDNGDGMTGEQMVQYINHLSSSSGVQSHVANFGVGAKIAAATRNHAGLVYVSWAEGVGYMAHLWKDPDTGEYGMHQLERPDGTFGHWARIDDEDYKQLKPDLIEGHGTKVVLLGMLEDANTMQAPEGATSPSRWVTRYLNTRYYRFPEGVNVRAREGWENDRSDKDRNVLRTITGQKKYLDQHATSSGSVELSNATAYWWILKGESALTQNSGFVASSGHCAALWKDELYEMTFGRGNTAALQNFGVVFGYQQVVIYIEPRQSLGVEIITNTARTHLLINNRPLPWAEWQEEFRSKMPRQIHAHMEEVAAKSEASDHTTAIRDRLKQIEELFKLSRYRPVKSGSLVIGDPTVGVGGNVRQGSSTGSAGSERGAGSSTGRSASVYSMFLSADGVPGEKAKADIYPEVRWISAADGTRDPGDMEDRAAKYLYAENLLLINSDFRVFADMKKRWAQHYSHAPGSETVVNEVVREWFEQSLVEVVLSSNALREAQHWTDEHVKRLLSEEGLTAAVLPRWHIEQNIKRTLGAKLGTLKPRAA